MRILFDNQKFTTDTVGGIVRIFAELMRHFDGRTDVAYDMPIAQSNNEYLAELPKFKDRLRAILPISRFWNLPCKGPLYRLWCQKVIGRDNQVLVEKALQRGDFDLFHPTYYDPYFLSRLKGRPFVLTIYDMIHETVLAHRSISRITAMRKKKLAQRAARIIAISQATKDDAVRILGIAPDRIDVVHLGNSLAVDAATLAQRPMDAPGKYILFVGNRDAYKNFTRFVEAVTPLLQNDKKLHVVCIGGGAFSAAECAQFAVADIVGQMHQKRTNDLGLAQYYAHAQLFVFPSLYEGFGVPILEAFACGCPVVLGDNGSLPEIGGEAALYFNPHDAHDMRRVIGEVLNSEKLQQQLRERGMIRGHDFSWEKCAQQTLDVYQRVLDEKKIQAAA